MHRQYLEAGADLIETNTFNATRVSQADYELERIVYELNREGARLARLECDAMEARTPAQPRFVVGVLGPTSRTASLSPDVNNPGFRNIHFDELVETYREAANGLIDGGADMIMVETIFDTLNAKAALFALDEVFADARRAPAGDDLRHHHRPLRPHAHRTDRRGVLVFGAPRQAAVDRLQLRARRERPAPAPRRAVRTRRHPCQHASERRPAECLRRLRRNARRHGRGARRVRARRPAQHRRRLLRHHARAHRRDRRRGARRRRRARWPRQRRTRAWPASNPS